MTNTNFSILFDTIAPKPLNLLNQPIHSNNSNLYTTNTYRNVYNVLITYKLKPLPTTYI